MPQLTDLEATQGLVTLAVDLAALPALISDSIRDCLAKHGIALPAAVQAEVGRNVAGAVQLTGEDLYEQQFAASILAPPAILDHEDHLDADVIIGAVLKDRHFEPANMQASVLANEILDLRIKLERATEEARRLANVNALLTGATVPAPTAPAPSPIMAEAIAS